MSKKWRLTLRGCIALCAVAGASPVLGASPGELRKEAEGLVAEALFHESLGMNDERAKLLAEAEAKSPGAANIQWAQGRVKYRGDWISIEQVPERMRANARLLRYEQRRADYPDTAAGQLALARYCQRQGLEDQARAHLVRVLDHDADNAEARRELGFANVDGQWLHQDDVAAARQAVAARQESFDRWQKRITDIRHDLTARSSAQREAAAKRLAQIDDPTAVAAIESLLCYGPSEVAAKALDTLSGMSAPEASLALARVAVYAALPEIREYAGNRLRGRAFEHYVPGMLAALATTIEARENVAVDADGRLVHQQVLVREGQDASQVLVRGTEYRREYTGGGSRRFAEWQAGLDMARQNASATQRVIAENASTLERNERITTALALGTEQRLGADPKQWWNWWNEYNDVQITGEKPVSVQVALRSVDVVDALPTSGSGSGSSGGGSKPECFVAGTPVRTSLGLVPIEQVRVGDLVLSQHPETGELTYKPVLRTTVTPTSPLLRVEAGNYDRFVCTDGHLFWVSGEGWKQARELRSGMQLHTPRGALTVSAVEPAKAEQTYNLIVADFHTYFAGERDVLTHDNTLRQPTRAIIPGVVLTK